MLLHDGRHSVALPVDDVMRTFCFSILCSLCSGSGLLKLALIDFFSESKTI